MKFIVKTLFLIFIALLSSLVCFSPGESFISTIFNVSGIIFSVGLGLIVTFNMNGIKNKDVIKSVRSNLSSVRNSFIFYFALSTSVYLLNNYLVDAKSTITTVIIFSKSINLNWLVSISVAMLYTIVYFVINFFKIQKLNEDIYDELNKD